MTLSNIYVYVLSYWLNKTSTESWTPNQFLQSIPVQGSVPNMTRLPSHTFSLIRPKTLKAFLLCESAAAAHITRRVTKGLSVCFWPFPA